MCIKGSGKATKGIAEGEVEASYCAEKGLEESDEEQSFTHETKTLKAGKKFCSIRYRKEDPKATSIDCGTYTVGVDLFEVDNNVLCATA